MQGKGLVEVQVLCNGIESRTINDRKSRLCNSNGLINPLYRDHISCRRPNTHLNTRTLQHTHSPSDIDTDKFHII